MTPRSKAWIVSLSALSAAALLAIMTLSGAGQAARHRPASSPRSASPKDPEQQALSAEVEQVSPSSDPESEVARQQVAIGEAVEDGGVDLADSGVAPPRPSSPGGLTRAGSPTLRVHGSDIAIKGKTEDGFYLRFPMLAGLEDPPYLYTFGARTGAPPVFLESHGFLSESAEDNTIEIDFDLLDVYDQVLITVPAWGGEEARTVGTATRYPSGMEIERPTTTPGEEVSLVSFRELGPDGFPVQSIQVASEGLSKRIPSREVGLVWFARR